MKIFTKILGIIILLGLVMAVAAFFMGLDVNNLKGFFTDEEAYGQMLTKTTDKTFDEIIVNLDTRNIIVNFVSEDEVSITYYAHESKDTWTFDDTVAGRYEITQKEKFKLFNFNYKYTPENVRTVNINIPDTWVIDFDLDTDTGHVRMEFDGTKEVGDLKLYSNTGSIYVKNVDAQSLDLKTDTGGVFVSDAIVDGNLLLDSDTGSTSLTNVKGGQMTLSTDTGYAKLTNVEGVSLNVDVDTGYVLISDSTFTQDIFIRSSTGNVTINDSEALSFDIKTSTGDVKMNHDDISEYRYDLKTDTGTIRIESANQGNRHSTTIGSIFVKIDVDTGDIRINS